MRKKRLVKIQSSCGKILFSQAEYATSFFQRLRGLMFAKPISKDQALIFLNAPAIHTSFMRFSIDIIFLNQKGEIIRIEQNLTPWKFTYCPNAKITIEVLGGRAEQLNLKPGMAIEIIF